MALWIKTPNSHGGDMKAVNYVRHAKARPFEALMFRGAALYEPALEGLTRAYVSKHFIEERERAKDGVEPLVRAAMARLDSREDGRTKWSYTKHHSLEVARFVYVMACEARMNGVAGAEALEPDLAFAGGLIHDVGKTFLPMYILVKELGVDFGLLTLFRDWPLTETERRILREEHISIGTRFVRLFGAGEHTRMMLDMVGLHHVLYDGANSGVPSYPSHIRGRDLPLHARIAKVADFLSAVMPRHYRSNGYIHSIDGAAAYAVSSAGVELDPDAVACFITGRFSVDFGEAKALVARLSHPMGHEGLCDVHLGRVYTKDIVLKDAEFLGMLERQDQGKAAAYNSALGRLAHGFGVGAGGAWSS